MAGQDPPQRGDGARMMIGLFELIERVPHRLDHVPGVPVISKPGHSLSEFDSG
jgi:hypothetical protein